MATKRKAAAHAAVPTITLGGKEYPVPRLVLRQICHVQAPLSEMNDRINEEIEKGRKLHKIFGGLAFDEYDRLVLKPIYWALTRANPEFTEEEFYDLEVEGAEIISAWFVVRDQSGLFTLRKQGASDEPGE